MVISPYKRDLSHSLFINTTHGKKYFSGVPKAVHTIQSLGRKKPYLSCLIVV
jgi:hypothetical protein